MCDVASVARVLLARAVSRAVRMCPGSMLEEFALAGWRLVSLLYCYPDLRSQRGHLYQALLPVEIHS